jgi:hypothetical protein
MTSSIAPPSPAPGYPAIAAAIHRERVHAAISEPRRVSGIRGTLIVSGKAMRRFE